MPDAAFYVAVRILAGELLGIGTGIRVWRTIGITFQGNRGHGDDRTFRKPLLQFVILRFAFSQAEPPAIVVDDDADMIRVLEGRRAPIERRVIEVPARRRRSSPPS